MRRTLTFLFAISVFATALAQKPVKVCGEYTYYVPENVSLAAAKQTALLRARVAGLIEKFNQTVYMENTSIVSNKNGESSIDFYSYGGSMARGEWIEDTEEPKYTIFYEQGMVVVKASVCGMAKEIKSAGIDLKVHVLRNRWELQYESDHFYSGDSVYLYFQSPVDGYVTVYLLNRESQTVSCLLPYRNSPEGAVAVKHDKEYIFFHQDPNTNNRYNEFNEVDEYTLFTNSDIEWNDLYIIFSQSHYTKAISHDEGSLSPRKLSFKDFSDWIIRCINKDKEMVVKKFPITIQRK